MNKKRKAKLESMGWCFGDYSKFLGLSEHERNSIDEMIIASYRHIDKSNIGQPDKDNSFMWKDDVLEQFAYWQSQNPNAIPIGFCDEVCRTIGGTKFIAFVFENENGNRYFVHVPEDWKNLKW